MPICNPIKRSAALLQSRYDSLLPRGTDRESGASQVSLCLGEGICVVKIHTIMAGATMCVYVSVSGGAFDPPQQGWNSISSGFGAISRQRLHVSG